MIIQVGHIANPIKGYSHPVYFNLPVGPDEIFVQEFRFCDEADMNYDENKNFIWPQDIEEPIDENLRGNPFVLNELPLNGEEFSEKLSDGETIG